MVNHQEKLNRILNRIKTSFCGETKINKFKGDFMSFIGWTGWRGSGKTVKKGMTKAVLSQSQNGKSETVTVAKKEKSLDQKIQQRERIVSSLVKKKQSLADNLSKLTDEADVLRKQWEDGSKLVQTRKKYKSTSEYSDIISATNAERKQRVRQITGQSEYVSRKKMTAKQRDSLAEKMNELDGKRFDIYDQMQRIDLRLRRVGDI
jgi:chromosome segregation ATPase